MINSEKVVVMMITQINYIIISSLRLFKYPL